MSNDFFNASGTPAQASSIVSPNVRAEFTAIGAGFDKLPTLTGNAYEVTYINASGTAMVSVGGNGLLKISTTGIPSVAAVGTDYTNLTVLSAATAAVPNDADLLPVVDTAVTKKLSLTNLKAFLKTYLDTLYGLLGTANIWSAAQTVTAASSAPLTVNSTQAAVNARIRLDTDKADSSVAYTLSNSQAGVNTQSSAVLGAGGGLQIYTAQSAGAQSTSGTLAVNINGSGVVTFPAGGVATALKSATTSVDTSAAAAPAAGQVLKATSSTTATWQSAGGITLGTPVASTSGTSIDFTGIPAGTKRITINFYGVSVSGTDAILVQLGDSGGIETTGYLGAGAFVGASTNCTNFTTGFGVVKTASASSLYNGSCVLSLENSSSNRWAAMAILADSASALVHPTAGVKPLSATLDRVRITVSGADTFDAGEINISYE